jgi:hypothetical protein
VAVAGGSTRERIGHSPAATTDTRTTSPTAWSKSGSTTRHSKSVRSYRLISMLRAPADNFGLASDHEDQAI